MSHTRVDEESKKSKTVAGGPKFLRERLVFSGFCESNALLGGDVPNLVPEL